jgi:hypothetical protein
MAKKTTSEEDVLRVLQFISDPELLSDVPRDLLVRAIGDLNHALRDLPRVSAIALMATAMLNQFGHLADG